MYSKQPNANDVAMLKAYLGYLLGDGQQLLAPLYYAPLPCEHRLEGRGAAEPDHLLRRPHDAGRLTMIGPVLMSATAQADPATPAGSASGLSPRRPLGDRAFQLLALAAGLLVLVILVLIAITMAQQSVAWFTTAGWSGIFSTDWNPAQDKFGAMAFVYGTVVTSVIAIIIAFPISIGIALLLTEVVPRRWSRPIVYVIDLLAVVPSVVWGLWGILVLVPWLQRPSTPRSPRRSNGIPVLGTLFGGSGDT